VTLSRKAITMGTGIIRHESGKVFEFFLKRFKDTHADIDYEVMKDDRYKIQDLVKRRGARETCLLIDRFFIQYPDSTWKYFNKSSRTVSSLQYSISQMIEEKDLQEKLNNKTYGKNQLLKGGYICG